MSVAIAQPSAAVTTLSMAGFALATSASPGPVNVICAMSGARYGPVRSLRYVFGATFGFVAQLILAGVGLAGIVGNNPLISKTLTAVGSVYMLYLAYQIARSAGEIESKRIERVPGLAAGALAQWANPKAWIVSVSGISIYVATKQAYIPWLLVFSALFLCICAVSLWTWTMLGNALSRRTGNVRILNRAMAVLLGISVIMLVQETFGLQ
ncbi:LysE family translocator [Salinisphaera sp. RV14]|uniref:LysE family translocator n=1 Tax=Salinisphaera sp. LB1 TaxID=2183911 RepID=UPI000D70710F|nr:LysE family translocator [Salinisphaera sp. LB1]